MLISIIMSSKYLTAKVLSKKLVDKHQNFLKQYKKEFDLLGKIIVLEEKKDQLEHWANTTSDEKTAQKFLKDKESADKKLMKLADELKKISSEGTSPRLKERHSLLKKELRNHRKALDYWWKIYKDLPTSIENNR